MDVTGSDRAGSCREWGEWLAEHRLEMDRGEAPWLAALAEFDRVQGWAVDGQLSGAHWLMWRTRMGRATAFEKLRIAHQLEARPLLAEALVQGRVSYSALRVITRIDDPDPAVDAALLDLAEAGSVSDVERAVQHYQRFADQERPPIDPVALRGVRIVRHGDGTAKIEITLTEVEVDEVAATLQAFVDLSAEEPGGAGGPARASGSESARGDRESGSESPGGDRESGSESPRGDSGACAGRDVGPSGSPRGDRWGPEGGSGVDWSERRADALMDMARTALAHARDGAAVGADRYMVHLVAREGSVELLDGTPVDVAVAAEVACDCSTVVHLGEPLALGRKAREWSTAQRRAILVRDGGFCRFPGCSHRIVDIHHLLPWEDGGPTDVGNGLLVCSRHHRLLHHGFSATGDTNGTVVVHRPDGTRLAESHPGGGKLSAVVAGSGPRDEDEESVD